ncbi:unnamed protein product [Cercospora beticola]|nr:unnamed protein product [Cercospora beticola]
MGQSSAFEAKVFTRDNAKAPNGTWKIPSGLEIVCRTCYLKGIATGELTLSQDFNITQTIDDLESTVSGVVQNITTEVGEVIGGFIDSAGEELKELILEGDFNFDDFKSPTWNYTFDMDDLPPIPDAKLRFTFDELELYMLIDTTLSLGATYTLPLYKSKTPLGVHITKDLELGIIFDVELILSAEAAIIIGSGFHLKIDDGFAIDIVLFGKDPSNLEFNGGQFELLPVTIEAGGVLFTAVLRVGVHTGMKLATPELPSWSIANRTLGGSVGGGIEVGVFANIAEMTTNITYVPDDEECAFGVVQSYKLALGANAGATIHVGTERWGPELKTSKAIYTTKLASACAISGTPAVTSAIPTATDAAILRRQGLSELELVHETTYTAVSCVSTGLVNCPASLQTTSTSSTTITLTTAVASGVDKKALSSSIWPGIDARQVAAAITTVAFGTNAVKLPTTSGSPVPYVASATGTVDGIRDDIEDAIKGLPKATIIGVSVGVGVPVVLSIALCCW